MDAWLDDGSHVDLGTAKQRAVFVALAMHAGRTVGADVLVDLVWGAQPPAAVSSALQAYVARLRRVLEPDRVPRAESAVLVSRPGGYALVLPDDGLDADVLAREVLAVRELVGARGLSEGIPGAEELRSRLDAALALWRGRPYDDLADAPAAAPERARLEDLHVVALEDRAALDLALGRHAIATSELERLTDLHPLRERLWALRALALYRSGRQADALGCLREVRELLGEELGLEPGEELRDLQQAILRQDPSLVVVGPEEHLEDRVGAGWPLVGRDDHLAALTALLGRPGTSFAVLTGEPGIGKSRLAGELAARARERGYRVLAGRCSQDEGAPPLWPWAAVLRDLGSELPYEAQTRDDATSRFRAWERIVRDVLVAAADQPTLVVLDDLHWADASTLRVLRLLTETTTAAQLLVLVAWRDRPPASGVLGEVAESIARRHAVRLPLTGLSTAAVAHVVESVSGAVPTDAEAAALQQRTDGNPFFLVEYSRLARDGGGFDDLLSEQHPPAALNDVLARRVETLPAATVSVLRLASVVGRDFDLATLARAAQQEEDAVLDALEPAIEAGLVREEGPDRTRFAHALVRDALYAGLSRARAGRMHTQIAVALAGRPTRVAEMARHWLAARRHGEAWRACLLAADAATLVFAYEEAETLLASAVSSVVADEGAGPEQEYDVLVAHARGLQRCGNWIELRASVHRLIELARRLGDLHRLAHVTTISIEGALWQTSQQGEVDLLVVEAQRECLDRLPSADSAERVRVMMSLVDEIYYVSSAAEREALAEEALAMARRLGDRRLLLWACLTMCTSTWRPGNAEQRMVVLGEARELALVVGDPLAYSSALTLSASATCELGRVEQLGPVVAAARSQAESLRHSYAELVLDALEVPFFAMRGEFDRVDAGISHLEELGQRLAIPMAGDTVAGCVAVKLLWQGEHRMLVETLRGIAGTSPLPVEPFVAALLCRAGQREEAAAYLAEHRLDLDHDTWFSSILWALSAEVALHLDHPEVAATAYTLLAPLAGRPASTGSAMALGPVDAWLAIAAAATGRLDLAATHAGDALTLCGAWQIPLVAEWFTRLRAEHGF